MLPYLPCHSCRHYVLPIFAVTAAFAAAITITADCGCRHCFVAAMIFFRLFRFRCHAMLLLR